MYLNTWSPVGTTIWEGCGLGGYHRVRLCVLKASCHSLLPFVVWDVSSQLFLQPSWTVNPIKCFLSQVPWSQCFITAGGKWVMAFFLYRLSGFTILVADLLQTHDYLNILSLPSYTLTVFQLFSPELANLFSWYLLSVPKNSAVILGSVFSITLMIP